MRATSEKTLRFDGGLEKAKEQFEQEEEEEGF